VGGEYAYMLLREVREAVENGWRHERLVPVWLPYAAALLMALGLSLALTEVHWHAGIVAANNTGSTAAAGAVAVGAAVSTVATLLFLAGLLLLFYTNYLLVLRRDRHFARSQLLFRRVVELLEALQLGDPELAAVRGRVEEMAERGQPRGPLFWALASTIVAPLWLYLAHTLTREFWEHEERERSILSNIASILVKRGIEFTPPQLTISRRDTALYVVATLLTLGLFALYWLYPLTVEPNRHLEEHWRYERRLVEALEALVDRVRRP
jgi:hypothetical protein